MIPKIIHYCWFGGKDKPKLVLKCIESWKKYCPDYQIIEWNETSFDISMNDYTQFTYENKCYAFLSDYVRLAVVYKYGGLYFDTDVELIKSPSFLLGNSAFFGFEDDTYVNTGIGFGSEAGNAVLKTMIDEYDNRDSSVYRNDYRERRMMTGSPTMNTTALKKFGMKSNGIQQKIGNVIILPKEYMCPFNDVTGEMKKTVNTFSIHLYGKSPQGKMAYLKSYFSRPIHRFIKKWKGLGNENQ